MTYENKAVLTLSPPCDKSLTLNPLSNKDMKIFIILVSILSMTATIGWMMRKHASPQGRLTLRQKAHIMITSLVTGIAVYFGLLLVALGWMTFR